MTSSEIDARIRESRQRFQEKRKAETAWLNDFCTSKEVNEILNDEDAFIKLRYIRTDDFTPVGLVVGVKKSGYTTYGWSALSAKDFNDPQWCCSKDYARRIAFSRNYDTHEINDLWKDISKIKDNFIKLELFDNLAKIMVELENA